MANGDGNKQRNSVIQGVQNKNNIADMYLGRQMVEFQKHLALKVLTIEMEKLEWHTFLKDLKKCDSDDLSEFVPFLIEEMGETEYTNRVKKLKTRFRDIFNAFELGMNEKVPVDYVRIREAGEKAQKDYRIARSEMRKMRVPLDTELMRPRINVHDMNNFERVTGFITNMPNTPGIEQVALANKAEQKPSARRVRCFGAPASSSRPIPVLPPPPPLKDDPFDFFSKSLQPEVAVKEEDDDDVDTVDLGPDSDEDQEKKKKKDMMRKMLDKNAKRMRRRRRERNKKPLESRIEEFYTKIEDMRCPPQNQPKNTRFPPIGVGGS